VKNTPQTHPDYNDLVAAIAKIEVMTLFSKFSETNFKIWLKTICCCLFLFSLSLSLSVQEVTTALNESERQAENMNKIFKIQEKLDGDYHDLLQPHRRLCKEGVLYLVKQKDIKVLQIFQWQKFSLTSHISSLFNIIFWSSQTDRYFYLFNDVLLHVKLSRKYLEKQKRVRKNNWISFFLSFCSLFLVWKNDLVHRIRILKLKLILKLLLQRWLLALW
jgi:uncharacterized protein Usg